MSLMTSPRANDESIASHGSSAIASSAIALSLVAESPVAESSAGDTCSTRFAIFSECPQCGHALHPEHAHYKCAGCGWRDSCCD